MAAQALELVRQVCFLLLLFFGRRFCCDTSKLGLSSMLRETSSNNTGQLLRHGHSISSNKLYEEMVSFETNVELL